MAKKRSARVATKRKTKKKSWWSIFFVFALATVIGYPIAAKMTFPSGQVAGISVVPTKTPSANHASLITLLKKSCTSGYTYVQYSCFNGYQGTYSNGSCQSAQSLVSIAESGCKSKALPTPAPTKSAGPTPTKPNFTPTPTKLLIKASLTPTKSL